MRLKILARDTIRGPVVIRPHNATARGGFDISVAPDLWRRMAIKGTAAIDFATTHPTTARRSAVLEMIVAEINGKKARGLELKPYLKKIPKAPEKTDTQFEGNDQ